MLLRNVLLAAVTATTAQAADCWTIDSKTRYHFNTAPANTLWGGRSFIANNCWQAPGCAWNREYYLTAFNMVEHFHQYVSTQGTPNQQYYWDISEEIMNQCVYDRPPDSSSNGLERTNNGGEWSFDGNIAKGGFWWSSTKSTDPQFNTRRSLDGRDLPEENQPASLLVVPDSGNVTLASGEVISAGRFISTSFNADTNETTVLHDFTIADDGTHVQTDRTGVVYDDQTGSLQQRRK